MSKILRRPMFRGGGKVSSYGNGIATGLADGGRPGYKDAGAITGKQISQEALAKIMGRRGTLIGDINRGLTKGNDFLYNNIAKPLGNLPYMASDYVFGTEYGEPIKNKNSFEEAIEMFGGENKILGSEGAVTGVDLPPGGGRTRFGTGEDYVEPTPAKKEKTLEELMAEMLGTKKSAKEKIAENKELFEEALGGGKKAKIQDASNMALSFAGKALKEGATVKSSFADFFDEESKRPSRSEKVSDAAGQAAIQAYLTGEQDYNTMMKQMKLIDYKTDQAVKSAKSNQTTDSLLEAFAGNNGDRTDEGVMQATYNTLYKETDPQIFQGKIPEDVKDLIVGKVYYADDPKNTRTKIIFLIQADGTPKEINRILK